MKKRALRFGLTALLLAVLVFPSLSCLAQEEKQKTWQDRIELNLDENGWLLPGDSQTDMGPQIMMLLATTGRCHLAPGVFYVRGSIIMPASTLLEGCGSQSVLRLMDDVKSGYILQIGCQNTVRNLSFSGGKTPEKLHEDGENLGSRHGIIYIGNENGQEPGFAGLRMENIIEDCWFENLDGSAFYSRNVGGQLWSGVKMSRCFIDSCKVGIHIAYRLEYSTFTDCSVQNCYYGCINNGGNNLFIGCSFHGVVGWMLEDRDNDNYNNGHGSCIGCIFNHQNNMNRAKTGQDGLALHIIGANHGFVFSACQFWYGNIPGPSLTKREHQGKRSWKQQKERNQKTRHNAVACQPESL